MADIQIIPSTQLNKKKWDTCIANSSNGLIYAYSYYLDTMANEWYGLIINDYASVLPIAIKKKFGFSYCYMPAFMQQLGFIGKQDFDVEATTKAIINFVKYGSPYLNFSNEYFASKNNCTSLSNYIIALDKNYAEIKSNYKKSIDYSLSKAAKVQLNYVVDENIAEAIELYKTYNQQNMQHVKADDYQNLQKLLTQLEQTQQILIRKATNNKKELLSIVLLLKDNKRYYNLINYTTEEGRKSEANYFLYDNILQELSEQNMLFDFEGSNIPGVKSFYEKFGAINQPFFHWHFNYLPFPLKLLKK